MGQARTGQCLLPPADIGRTCKSTRNRIPYRRWTKKSNTWEDIEPPAPPWYNVERGLREALEVQNKSNPVGTAACGQHCVGGKGGSGPRDVWDAGVRFYCPSTVAARFEDIHRRTFHSSRRRALTSCMCGAHIRHQRRGGPLDLHHTVGRFKLVRHDPFEFSDCLSKSSSMFPTRSAGS